METSELEITTTTTTAFPVRSTKRDRREKHYEMALHWHPHFINDLPKAIDGVKLAWSVFEFEKKSLKLIPNEAGVYCFAASIGPAFPQALCIPLYIGSASPGTLRARYTQYLDKHAPTVGREKISRMLNEYQGRLVFFCAPIPKWGTVEAIEFHLIWACLPPCNTQHHAALRELRWGKAF